MDAESRLSKLGIVLPPPMKPAGLYRPVVVANGMAHVSGQGPVHGDGRLTTGRVPDVRTIDEAVAAARLTGLNVLAQLRAHLGSLDRVAEVVKVLGFVNAAPGFEYTPKVIDGFSDLMVEIFGEAGKGARSAVGSPALPFDITVEVEMTVALQD